MDFTGFIRIDWVLLGARRCYYYFFFAQCCSFSLGLFWFDFFFQRALRGLTGFLRVLLGFTGFHGYIRFNHFRFLALAFKSSIFSSARFI